MEEQRFDELTRALARPTSRRQMLKVLGAAIFGGWAAARAAPRVLATSGTCATEGKSCAAEHCCQGLTCLQYGSNATLKACCTNNLVCGSKCCPALASCSGGHCVCPAGLTACPNPAPFGMCVNTQTDVNNCGSCGTVCGTGIFCCGGVCTTCPAGGFCLGTTCVCPPQTLSCNGQCLCGCGPTDTCDSCEAPVCPSGSTCISGVCYAATCQAGVTGVFCGSSVTSGCVCGVTTVGNPMCVTQPDNCPTLTQGNQCTQSSECPSGTYCIQGETAPLANGGSLCTFNFCGTPCTS
jgi:hypothetical protein